MAPADGTGAAEADDAILEGIGPARTESLAGPCDDGGYRASVGRRVVTSLTSD